MAVTTISARQSAFVTRVLLKASETQDIYGVAGTPPAPRKDTIPAHASTTCQWRRYENQSTTPKVLTEGVTPDAGSQTYTDITVTLTQFGDFVILSDISVDTVEDPILAITGQRQGEQAINWMNQVRYGVIKAGTTYMYANGTARTDVNTLLTQTLIEKATRTLAINKARKFTKMLAATAGYNTSPIPASYIGFCSSYTAYNIRNTIGETNGFVPVEKYAKTAYMRENEIGKVGQVRFIEDPDQAYWDSAGAAKGVTGYKTTDDVSLDVFGTVICGEEAYGIVMFGGYGGKDGVKSYVETSGGTSDPLHQRNTVGWKTMQAAKILNDSNMIRIEHCVTA